MHKWLLLLLCICQISVARLWWLSIIGLTVCLVTPLLHFVKWFIFKDRAYCGAFWLKSGLEPCLEKLWTAHHKPREAICDIMYQVSEYLIGILSLCFEMLYSIRRDVASLCSGAIKIFTLFSNYTTPFPMSQNITLLAMWLLPFTLLLSYAVYPESIWLCESDEAAINEEWQVAFVLQDTEERPCSESAPESWVSTKNTLPTPPL